MNKQPNNTQLATVSIAGEQIDKIEYKGETVVTFAQIDKVHERTAGTAGRNFRDNRTRFTEGADYFELTSDEIRRMSEHGIFPPRSARGTLITRKGYLKLVKPMNDDRSWEVQGEMIDCYFANGNRSITIEPQAQIPKETRLQHKHWLTVGKMMGLEGNQLILSANKVTQIITGFDVAGAMGASHLEAPSQHQNANATKLGQIIGGMSAQKVNAALMHFDFQIPFRDDKGVLKYEPTEKGKRCGGRLMDTMKKHTNGSPVMQLMWSTKTAEYLKADLDAEVAQ